MTHAEAQAMIPGTGEMAQRIRSHDWSSTPLGALAAWPLGLRMAVAMMVESPTAMAIAWGEEHTLFYNDGYKALLGGAKHPGALGSPGAAVWPEIWDVIGPMWQGALAGRPVNFKDAPLTIERDGIRQECHFDFSCSPVRDETGAIRGVMSTAIETTDRVRSTRQLHNDRDELRLLFAQAPAAVAILRGPSLRFDLANTHYQRLVSKTEAQLVGRTLREVFPELSESVHTVLQGVLDTGERFVASEWAVALDWRGDGDVHARHLNLIYEPVVNSDQSVDGIMVFAFDVSEQVKARHLIRDAEQKTRFAIEAADMGEWSLELATGKASRSARHDQCFGYDTMLPSWTYQDFLSHVLPSYRESIDQLFQGAIAGGGSWRFECPVQWPDRSVHWIASRARVHLDAQGQPVQLSGLVWDITESRLAHEAVREASRQKDEFLATLAHELRNPLAPIRNAAHVLGKSPLSPTHLEWCRDVITRQVSHMALLLDDLLDVSRISTGRIQLRKEAVPLQAVVQSAVEAAGPLMQRKNHTLRLDLPPQAVTVEVDSLRMAQVLSNLLTNAAKYTDPGGLIELEVEQRGSGLHIRVRDNGIGIDVQALPNLFQMFSQIDAPVDRSEGGLGIGLALSKGLVELHGGSLHAHSAGLGFGTTLEVQLPAAAVLTTVPGTPAARTAEQPRAAAKVVMVVDDNRDAADSLAMLVSLEGHEVIVAYNGPQALRLGLEKRPDLVVLDIGMPGMNGYELARCIRQQPWGEHAFMVAATGWGQESDQRQSASAGFDRHLTKPVDPSELITLLTEAVRQP